METMQIVNLVIYLVLFISFLIFKRKEIISFFRPNLYVEVEMLEMDNSCSAWLQKKNKDLQFTFNGGLYNMFTGEKRNFNSIYRKGRLAKLFYVEGNENPIDFRRIESTGNPNLNSSILAQNFDLLFLSGTGLGSLLKDYGAYIVGAIVVIMILVNSGGV